MILFLLLAGGESFSQTIGIRIPDTTGVQGTYVDVPMYADSTFTDNEVLSYVVSFNYNSTYLRADSVITEGTIAGAFGAATANLDNPGEVVIAGAGSSPLTGSGTFVVIRFELLNPGTVYFTFSGPEGNYLNEGTPEMVQQNGRISIAPAPKITIGPNSSLLQSGEQLQMVVSGDTLSPFIWEVADTAVATINQDGLLTAKGPGHTKVSVTDNNGLTDITDGSIEVRGYRLSVPDNLKEWQGGTIDIPVNTTDLSGLDVVSGNFTITYNQSVLEFVDIHTDTTLLDGIVPQYNLGNNAIDIAFAADAPLTGEGALMYLRFHVSSENTGATSLGFSDVVFNEDLLAMVVNGYFSTINFANINISPNTTTMIAGDSLQLSASNGILPYTWSSSDTTVARIDTTGMLFGVQSGIVQITVVDSVGATKTSGNITVIDTEVFVPDTTGPVNGAFNLPVYIDDLPQGRTVSSLEAEFSFRTPELEYVEIVTAGALTNGWTFSESSSGNSINLAMAGANGFSQEGILFFIRFNLTADLTLNENAYVNINNVLLNEGVPNARTFNGSISGSKSEDLGVSAILSPASACELTEAENVTVSVHNYGYITYSAGDTIVVGYQLNSETPVTDTLILAAELPPSSSVDFTFDSTLNMSAPGTYSLSAYTLLSSDFDGNTGNDKKTVQIEAYGDLAVSLGSDVVACEGDTVVLQAGAGFESYTWSNGGSTTEMVEVTDPGSYAVVVTNALGCEGTDTVSVSFTIPPTIDLDNDTTICEGAAFTLDAGTGFTAYSWNGGVSSSQQFSVDTSGAYFVEVTDNNGCSSISDTINVTVLPLPVVDLGADTALCAGEILELSAGTGFSSYAWSTGNSTEAISIDQPGTYIVTVGNENGCLGSDTIVVDFVQVDVNLGEDVFLCEGSDYTIQAPTGDYLYEWSDNSTGSAITVNQTGTYSVTVTDIVTGCSDADTIYVSFSADISVDLGPDIYTCSTEPVVLFAGDAFDTYSWEGSTETSSSLMVTEAGTYVVTVTSGSNCSATDTAEVFYNPAPTLELGGDIAACAGDTVLLVGPSGFSVYNWNNGMSDNDTLHVTEAGTYVLEVANESGCTVKDSLNVAFNSIPDITISGDTIICEGSTVELTASGADAYEWSTGETSASIFVSPMETMNYEVRGTVNACAATSSITVHVSESYLIEESLTICEGDSVLWEGNYYSIAGTYDVSYTSSSGCDSTIVLNLTMFDIPETPVVTFSDSILTSSATEGNQWYLNGTAIEGASAQTFEVIEEGNYYVIVTSVNGCVSAPSDTLAVTFTNIADFNNFNVNIYPNPATEMLFIENNSGMDMQFEIYDLTGKKMKNTIIRNNFEEVDVIDLEPSLYFLRITIDGNTRVDKVIIE